MDVRFSRSGQMMIQRVFFVLSGLAIVCGMVSGCAPAASVDNPALAVPLESPTPSSPAPATPTPTPFSFSAGNLLFVEVWEERVSKSATGGQTTSFVGEQVAYNYDPVVGTLSGPLEGALTGDTPVVVGHMVVNQIDRNKAAAGWLHALPEGGQSFGPIVVERAEADGSVSFVFGGTQYFLKPGESVRLEVETGVDAASGSLPAGQTQHTVTVTNHGFLPIGGLTVVAP